MCISPILAAYFTSPMIKEVQNKTNKCIEESTELSPLIKDKKIMLSPITLYIDDGAILTSSPDLNTMALNPHMAITEGTMIGSSQK